MQPKNYSWPAVVKSDNGQTILIHTVPNGIYQARIRAHKLDVNGQLLWGTNGVMIQNNGQMASYQVPEVEPDGNNGALISWYDGRAMNNLSSSFVQRISSTGSLYFPADGSEGSLAAQRNKFYPQVAFNLATQETYLFWMETEPDQNQNGIYGQKFSASGNRLWGSSGKVFIPLSAPNTKSISDLSSQMGTEKVYLFYLESAGSGLNTKTLGFACDTSGAFLWPGNIVTLSNPTQEKLQMETALDVYKNCKLVWGDRRLDSQGIYAQDINPQGQLGQPVIPVELTTFTGTVQGNAVHLKWSTSTETNNRGFEIERRISSPEFEIRNSEFELIGFVDGNGTTTEPMSYSFIDENVLPGNYQYRLKQIDYDGTFGYSNTIEVEMISPVEFALEQNYPNPFNPSTVIEFSLPEDVSNVKLSIYNSLGEKVAELVNTALMAGKYQYHWNAQNVATGMYIYELTNR